MFEQSNIRINFNNADYSNLIITERDRGILRYLGAEVAEISSRTIMDNRKKLWQDHNSLRKTRPVILCDPENGWNEIITKDQIECTNSIARHWEAHLKKQIFWGNEMNDDYTVTPFFDLPMIYQETQWDIENSRRSATEKKALSNGGAYHIDTILEDYSQLDKIVMPTLTINQSLTDELISIASEIFKDSLTPRINTVWFWSFGLTDEFTFLRGMDKLFMDFYDSPDKIHSLMKILLKGTNKKLDYFEDNNLLNLNNDESYVGSGGLGYTDELPSKTFEGIVRTKDMWGLAESQVTVGVSPDMFREFVFPYQKELMERFGLSCYGCCEPMDDRFDIVKAASNLRRVSVSPWADKRIMADKLKNDYIYSLKPNPSYLAMPVVDEDLIRKDIRESLNIAGNNCLELIMKDNHTIGGKPENLKSWTRIVHEEIDRM